MRSAKAKDPKEGEADLRKHAKSRMQLGAYGAELAERITALTQAM